MASLSDSVGLLFRIQAKNEASGALSEVQKDVENLTKKGQSDFASFSAGIDKETQAIKSATGDVFKGFAQDLGLTAEQVGQLSAALPIAGAAIAGVGAVVAVAVVAVAALGKELFDLATEASDYGSAIKDAKDQTGLHAEALSAMRSAADQAGTSFDSVVGAVSKFSKTVGEAAQGSQEAKDKLIALGVDPQEAMNDLEGSLAKVFQRIVSLPDPISQTKAATDAFGKAGADLLPFIKQFDGDLPGLIQKAKELGLVLSDADAEAADEFGDTLATLKTQLQNLLFTFAKEFMPAFTTGMNDFTEFLRDNRETVREWGEEFGTIIRGITAILESDVAKWTVKIAEFVASTGLQNLADVLSHFDPESNTPKFGKVDYKANPDGTFTPNYDSPFMSPLDNDKDVTGKKKLPVITSDQLKSGYLRDLGKEREEAKKAGEELEKQVKADLNAQIQRRKNLLQTAQDDLTKAFSKLQEIFKKTGDTKFFSEQITDAINHYKNEVKDVLGILDPLEAQQQAQLNKTPAELQLLVDNQTTRHNELAEKATDIQKKAEQAITDNAKKQSQERIKNTKQEIDSEIDLREAANKKVLAQREAGGASPRDLLKVKQGLNAIYGETDKSVDYKDPLNTAFLTDEGKKIDVISGFLAFRKQKLIEELNSVKGSADEELRIRRELAKLKEQIETAYYSQKKEQADFDAKETKKNADEELKQTEQLLRLKYEVLKAENDITEFHNEQERKSIVNAVELLSGSQRLEALRALRDFDVQESTRRQKAIDDELESQKQLALADAKKIKDLEKRKELEEQINKLFNERTKLSGEEKAAQDAETEKQYARSVKNSTSGEYGGGAFGDFMGSMAIISDPTVSANEKVADSIKSLSGAYDLLKQSAGAAVSGMIAGGQDLLAQWILTGKAGGQVFKNLAAQIISSLIVQAGVKAIFEVAEGFAALGRYDFVSAGNHFASAKMYGTVAAVAAVAAVGLRAAIGSSGAGQSAFNNSTSSATSSKDQSAPAREINESRRQAEEADRKQIRDLLERGIRVHQVLEVQSDDSHVVRVITQNGNDRGEIDEWFTKQFNRRI